MTESAYKKKMDYHCRRFNIDNRKNGMILSYKLKHEPGKITSEIKLNQTIVLSGSVSLQKTPNTFKVLDNLYNGFVSSMVHIAINAINNAHKENEARAAQDLAEKKSSNKWYKKIYKKILAISARS